MQMSTILMTMMTTICIEPVGLESCDESESEDDEDNEDCESHLQEFDAMMENFKQKVKDKWDEPTSKSAFKSFKSSFRKKFFVPK